MLVESIAFAAAVVLGLTFVVSGLRKLRDLHGFVLGVLEYEVLPRPVAIAYARSLPFIELVCGAALLAGFWPGVTGLGAATLLASFLVAVSINLARGRQVDCHCFGSQDARPVGWPTLARLAVLLACAAGAATGRGPGPLAPPPSEPLPALLLALGVLAGVHLLLAIPASASLAPGDQTRNPKEV